MGVSYAVLELRATDSYHESVSHCVEDAKQYKGCQTAANLLVITRLFGSMLSTVLVDNGAMLVWSWLWRKGFDNGGDGGGGNGVEVVVIVK